MASLSSSNSPQLVTAVSSTGDGLVAVAHPAQQDASSSSSWRVGLYNVNKTGGGIGYLQTTLTANLTSNAGKSKNRPISGKIQRLLFLGGSSSSSSHFLAAVSSKGVVVWDLRRGVVAHTIIPTKKSSSSQHSSYTIVDAQVAAIGHSSTSSDAALVNARSLYLLVQHVEGAAAEAGGGGGSDDDDNANDNDDNGSGNKKLVIWQYDGSQLVRKIKTKSVDGDGGSGGGPSCRLLVSPLAQFLYVSSKRKLRAYSGDTGKAVHKFSFSSPIVAVTAASGVGGGAYVLLESGVIHCVDPADGNTKTTPVATTAVSSLALASSPSLSSGPMLERLPTSDGSVDECLIVDGKNLIAVSDDATSSPKPLLNLTTADSGVVRCAGSSHTSSKGRGTAVLVAVLYKGGGVQIQSRTHEGVDSVAQFAWHEADDEAGPSVSGSDPSGKRLKTHGDQGRGPAILGPAQAGGTARHVHEPGMAAAVNDDEGGRDEDVGDDDDDEDDDEESTGPPRKRSRSVDQSNNDETIASRLAQLQAQLIADEEEEARQDAVALSGGPMSATAANSGETVTFHPKKATTESLSQLLKQALQDESLLELCLAVTNPSIIKESVSNLPPSDVSALVAAITSRVAFRPARAEVLCLWLTALLQTRKASLDVLQPLQNLINDRVELLPALLKLEGRLSLLNP